ncbi:hypothetical protein IWW50_002110 [Coemansia erecta]|nr:hypothetical protein IWW50_002110 [Coemansia erecta]
MDFSEDEIDRKRLICLDTESSICLSFDKSLYDSTIPDLNRTKVARPQRYATAQSADTPFIPRVLEINGSGDSQHHFTKQLAANDAQSISSNGQSMATADMALSDGDSLAEMCGSQADFDRELQAAVDLMLQGSMSPGMHAHRAYYMGNRPLVAALDPPYAASDSPMHEPLAKPLRRMLDRSKQLGSQLGARLAGRFGKRNVDEPTDGSIDNMSVVSDCRATKRMVDDSLSADVDEKHVAFAEPPSSAPSRVARMVGPIVRCMQRRPMATLGIVLGVLVALLVIIVVILVIGVFPFLIRSTLQDVSLVVTSVHASTPAEVSRVLKTTGKNGLHDKLFRAGGHALHRRDGSVVGQRSPLPDSARNVMGPMGLSQVLAGLPESTRNAIGPANTGQVLAPPGQRTVNAPHALMPNPTHPVSGAQQRLSALPNTFKPTPSAARPTGTLTAGTHPPENNRDDVVTITSVSMSTMHVIPFRAAPTAAASDISQGFKGLDAEVPPLKYTMQFGGNLTSGGPIGVDIEFVEPLRMYWRDTEVGAIDKPGDIHVPSRGTTQWSWPSFDVTVSQAPVISGSNKKLEIPHKLAHKPAGSSGSASADPGQDNAVAQSRAMGGTSMLGRAAEEDAETRDRLVEWFAAIQAHRTFTMQWKSRVRVSAMGLHTNNVKFEKTVQVTCGSDKDCVISG